MTSDLTKLSYSQLQQLKELERTTLKPACPACGGAHLSFKGAIYVGEMVVLGRVTANENSAMARRICGDCGHVMLFDLGQISG